VDSTQKKLVTNHQLFDSKRRELTTQLEELNSSGKISTLGVTDNSKGSDFSTYKAKVQIAYDECMDVKVNYNKCKKKLRKLLQLRDDVTGVKTVAKETLPEKCEMERWVVKIICNANA
jgi:seryl-tRNA synthetase